MAGGSKSKIKGNSAERELCKILSNILGGSFLRANSSGAFIGGLNQKRKANLSENQIRNAKSDIVPPDHMPKLVIESKSYKEFAFHQLMTPDPSPQLDIWIKQTMDTIDPGDQWFVCFKITRKGWYICLPFSDQYILKNHCAYTGNHGMFQITDLTEFLTLNRELILKNCS